MRRLGAFLILIGVLLTGTLVHAEDKVSYTSQPDEITVFLNDIAYARDTFTLPGGVDVQVILPPTVYPDTLVLRENGARVATYRMSQDAGGLVVAWQSAAGSESREVSLEYLLRGISWRPKYDMWLGADTDETVDFTFFAQIDNGALTLDNIDMQLAAGRVDTSQQLTNVSTITANQYIAGYEQSSGTQETPTGAANIQHIYTVGSVSAAPGETVYTELLEKTLPARRLLLWNAQTDDQVTIIYKVTNDSDLLFAEGIVRSYQNGMFIGSDFIELTPSGSEGSVTVGHLQTVRVNRSETQTALDSVFYDRDTQHDVTLTVSNFGDAAVTLDVVDRYSPNAVEMSFSADPERQGDNILRWTVTVEPGADTTITYSFKD